MTTAASERRLPTPGANFTATLLPRNAEEHDFELTYKASSRTWATT